MLNQNIILWSLLITMFSCNKHDRIEAKLTSISESVYASGFIKSVNQYKVYSEVNGIIQKKHVFRGEIIRENDSLFTIENKTSKFNTRNDQIAYDLSKENIKNINDQKRESEQLKKIYLQDSLTYLRYQKLWNQNVGTKSDLEQKILNYQNSKKNYINSLNRTKHAEDEYNLQLERAKNNIEIRKEIENEFVVRSKSNGKVYDILIEEGESVTPQTPLAIIGKPDQFLIEIQVDEDDIIKIKPGQMIYVSMESYKDKVFKAKVNLIYPFMDEESGTFTVEGVFTDGPKNLYPNLTVEANILIRTKENALVIPRDYLVNDSYVLTEPKKKTKVKVGLKNYENVEITGGLKEGQYIYKP